MCTTCNDDFCPRCSVSYPCTLCLADCDGDFLDTHGRCPDCAATVAANDDVDGELAADAEYGTWLDARAAEALAHQDDAEVLAGVGEWRAAVGS